MAGLLLGNAAPAQATLGCDGLALVAMPGQPVLLMHGTVDPASESRPYEALVAALVDTGASVRLRVLTRASYAWDSPAFAAGRAMLPRPDVAGRVPAEPWPALAVLSASEVAGFFATSLLGRRL
jgi:dienelactone hydrolase